MPLNRTPRTHTRKKLAKARNTLRAMVCAEPPCDCCTNERTAIAALGAVIAGRDEERKARVAANAKAANK